MPISDLLASITGEHSTSSAPNPYLQRNASIEIRRPTDNPGLKRPANSQNNIKHATKQSSPNGKNEANKQNSAEGRNGTSGRNEADGQSGQAATTPVSAGPPKKLKKGSFKEIMARAKSAQATLGGQVGRIQHKKIEKQPNRREREDLKIKKGVSIQSALEPGSKFQNGKGIALVAKTKDGKNSKVLVEPLKKIRKAALATTGYTGTARPKATSRPKCSSSLTSKVHLAKRQPESSRDNYRYTNEEDENEDDDSAYGRSEDEGGYGSEGSSDMEAAVFEVDDEEEKATRIARKEDIAAAKEEARLKREKEEKRRVLAKLAASKR